MTVRKFRMPRQLMIFSWAIDAGPLNVAVRFAILGRVGPRVFKQVAP